MSQEKRKRIQISNSGRPLDNDIHVLDDDLQTLRFVPVHAEADKVPEGLETITEFARADTDTLDREVKAARDLLNPLLRAAEDAVTTACAPLRARASYYRGLRDMDWPGVAARVSASGHTLPNLHAIMTGATMVYEMADVYEKQVSQVRDKIRLLHVTRREVGAYTFEAEVKELARRLRALTTDVPPAVTRAVTQLEEHVAKATAIIAKCTGATGAVVRAEEPTPEGAPGHYESFTNFPR